MIFAAGELLQYLPAVFILCYNALMGNINIEELKRRESLKKLTRACKDKLYEIAYEEEQKKKKSK